MLRSVRSKELCLIHQEQWAKDLQPLKRVSFPRGPSIAVGSSSSCPCSRRLSWWCGEQHFCVFLPCPPQHVPQPSVGIWDLIPLSGVARAPALFPSASLKPLSTQLFGEVLPPSGLVRGQSSLRGRLSAPGQLLYLWAAHSWAPYWSGLHAARGVGDGGGEAAGRGPWRLQGNVQPP